MTGWSASDACGWPRTRPFAHAGKSEPAFNPAVAASLPLFAILHDDGATGGACQAKRPTGRPRGAA